MWKDSKHVLKDCNNKSVSSEQLPFGSINQGEMPVKEVNEIENEGAPVRKLSNCNISHKNNNELCPETIITHCDVSEYNFDNAETLEFQNALVWNAPFQSISLVQGHPFVTITAAVIPNDFVVTLATFVICQAKQIECRNEQLFSYKQQPGRTA